MARAELRSILVGLAASGFLVGCVDGTGGTTANDAPGLLASPGTKKSGNREIEAPEVFQTTDSALWDGRPSLGGIWVASPEVTDPERVVMFNPATGKTVTGALFRRERDNPGPTLQISSDAAEALGILAGQPTEIKVTALRKEEVEEPAEAALAADPGAADAQTPSEDPATEGATAKGAAPDSDAAATAALATAALDAADAGATAVAETADGALPDAGPVEPPKKKTWKERRTEAKAKREADKAAKAAAKAAAAAGTTVEAAPLDSVDPADSAVATIETAPLDARAPKATTPEAAAPDAVAEVPAPTAPAAGGARPIQIASFSKEENAKRAVEALAKIGITAQPQKSGTATKAVWGVVASGDAALLAKIKGAGFADAYFLQ